MKSRLVHIAILIVGLSAPAFAQGLAADNTWTNNNRFAGPIPFIDVSAFMPSGGCNEANYGGGSGMNNALAVTSTTTGSATITVTGGYASGYKVGCGIKVTGAGATSGLAQPSISAVTSHITGGSTTIKYQIVAVDNNEGVSKASTVYSFTTSDTYANLTTHHYNVIKAAAISNAVLYCFYSDQGSGGNLTAIGCDAVPVYKDRGYTTPVPLFLPANPPGAATAQSIYTTLLSSTLVGGTTYTFVMNVNASQTVASGNYASHDISTFLYSALTTSGAALGQVGATYIVPPGYYTLAHNPFQGYGVRLQAVGEIFTAELPITLQAGSIDGSEATGSCGNFSPYQCAVFTPSPTTPIAIVLISGATVKNLSMNSTGPSTTGIQGVGIFVTQGGSDTIERTNISEKTTANDCPVQFDSNVIVGYIYDNQFTAGTGSQAGGSVCFSMFTASNSSSSLDFRDNWFNERGIWLDNPGTGTQSVLISSSFYWNNTENNYDNGLFNIDVGTTGQLGQIGAISLYGLTQDNTHNSGANFTTIYCYNSANPGASCGGNQLGVDSNSASPNVMRSSNPSTSYLNDQGFAGTAIDHGSYSSTTGFSVETNPAGGAVILGGPGSLLGSDAAVSSPGAQGDVGFAQLIPPPYISSLTASGSGSGFSGGLRCYRMAAFDSALGESAAGPENCITITAGQNIAVSWSDQIGPQTYCVKIYEGSSASTPAAPGETVYIQASGLSVGCIQNAGVSTGSFNDNGANGTNTTTSGSPKTNSNAYISRQCFDSASYCWILDDGDTGTSNYSALGIHTNCSGCVAAGIGLDIKKPVRIQNNFVAGGTAASLSGTGACATITTQLGGAWGGSLKCTGTTGASTTIISPGSTAPNGWSCSASDLTTANALRQSASSATTCTISGTVNSNDVLTFTAIAF